MKISRLDRIGNWTGKANEAGYSVTKLADLCHCSKRHLERYWMERLNTTPHQLLAEVRMRIACAQLREGWTVKQVALELGYKSVAQFCRDFKKRYGVSPGQFASSRAGIQALGQNTDFSSPVSACGQKTNAAAASGF